MSQSINPSLNPNHEGGLFVWTTIGRSRTTDTERTTDTRGRVGGRGDAEETKDDGDGGGDEGW